MSYSDTQGGRQGGPHTARTLKEMPASQRPRERLLALGAGALSDAELLAIILRVGSADRSAVELAMQILRHLGSLRELSRAAPQELMSMNGVGPAKAAQLLAALELGRRMADEPAVQRAVIDGPESVARLFMSSMRGLDREHFRILCLDSRHHVLADEVVSVGTVNSSLAHPRECFRPAIRHGSVAVILAHNHPGGDPTPSADDVQITRTLAEAGRVLGIQVLDHVIIGDGRWVSLKERGML